MIVLVLIAVAMAPMALGATVHAPRKSPCCMPDQYSTIMTNMATINTRAVNILDVQVDYTAKKMVLINYTIPYPPAVGRSAAQFRLLIDYGKNMLYVILGSQLGQCFKYPYNETLHQCIPDDAMYLGHDDLGPLGKDGLSYDVFRVKVSLIAGKRRAAQGPTAFVTLALHRTPDACVPVVEGSNLPSQPNLNQLYMFSNFQNKLKDRSEFNLPPSCYQ